MESDRKRVPRLRQLTNVERATSRKASESWQMFTIMAEFIDAAERLSEIRPAGLNPAPALKRLAGLL